MTSEAPMKTHLSICGLGCATQTTPGDRLASAIPTKDCEDADSDEAFGTTSCDSTSTLSAAAPSGRRELPLPRTWTSAASARRTRLQCGFLWEPLRGIYRKIFRVIYIYIYRKYLRKYIGKQIGHIYIYIYTQH